MKIIQIVVDKLPKSASECAFAVDEWNPHSGFEEVGCRLTVEKVFTSVQKYYTQRCQNCLLVEEEQNELPKL